MSELLAVQQISKSFRGLKALANVSFEIQPNTIAALIGPNGAGKTTLFNIIAGAQTADRGAIVFDGRRIDGLRPDQICHLGIARTFQIVKTFAGLTVLDNVVVGALGHYARVKEACEHADTILEVVGLGPKRNLPSAMLTLPDRKLLELARALATRPKLLLLDEVLGGLRPTECDRVLELLRSIAEREGITLILIEHVMRAVMALAHTVIVLHHGEVIAQGRPSDIVRHSAVLDCYLGVEIGDNDAGHL
ncbi:MAG TPA: ABC transporter ATP-binding protein [Candidatus Binatia bacterium]